jgi:hypothetical protein
MKKIVLATLVTLIGLLANAELLKISSNSFVGKNGSIDYHLVVRNDGSIIIYAGRSKPSEVTIVETRDERNADGNLEIKFSNGLKLIQTSGFIYDGKTKIYLENENKEQIQMTPEVRLEVVK